MNTNNTNAAVYKAYTNPAMIREMELADFKWLAEVKPQWDDWISSACYSKRHYFHEKLADRFLEIKNLLDIHSHADAAYLSNLTEINKYIEIFLGYTPTPRKPSRWG